jgi:hypothetical protein
MVAIYIAGFVILFAVANGVCTTLASRGKNSSSIRPLGVGSSPLSRSDLLLENLALRQELSVLKARQAESRLRTTDKLATKKDGRGDASDIAQLVKHLPSSAA